MKVVELFCGTKSITKAFQRKGHECFTVDIDKQFHPNLLKNMLDVELNDFPMRFRNPDVVWASVPCTTFSVASLRHYWDDGKPKSWKTYVGIALLMKTISLIEQMNPTYWFIENPRGMMRKQRCMSGFIRRT